MLGCGRGYLFRNLVVVAGAALFIVGCRDSASPTGPTPAGSVGGAWVGTYINDNMEFDCNISFAAQATFEQDGSVVRGSLSTAPDLCGLGGLGGLGEETFVGTLTGNQLMGKTSIGSRELGGDARGTVSGSTLEIGLGIVGSYANGGHLHLHR